MKEAKEYFDFYDVSCSSDAKETFNQIRISHNIEEYRHLGKIVSLSVKISKRVNHKKILKSDVLSALILFYLTDRKHGNNELFEKLKPIISDDIEFNTIVTNLILGQFIEKQDGYLKINSEQLFRDT